MNKSLKDLDTGLHVYLITNNETLCHQIQNHYVGNPLTPDLRIHDAFST